MPVQPIALPQPDTASAATTPIGNQGGTLGTGLICQRRALAPPTNYLKLPRTKTRFAVPGLFSESGLALLTASRGAGKSHLATLTAVTLQHASETYQCSPQAAQPVHLFGSAEFPVERTTAPGHTLFVSAEEDAGESGELFANIVAGTGIPAPSGMFFKYVHDDHDQSGNRFDLNRVGEMLHLFWQAGAPLRRFFIDSMTSVLPPDVDGDSDNQGVRRVLGQVRAAARKYGCLIVILHHFGRQESGDGRGASEFGNVADTVITLRRALKSKRDKRKVYHKDRVWITVAKQRKGREIEPFLLRYVWGPNDEFHALRLERGQDVPENEVSDDPRAQRILEAMRSLSAASQSATTAAIIEATGLARTTVRELLSELVRVGQLRQAGKQGRSNTYELCAESPRDGDRSTQPPRPLHSPSPGPAQQTKQREATLDEKPTPPRGAAE